MHNVGDISTHLFDLVDSWIKVGLWGFVGTVLRFFWARRRGRKTLAHNLIGWIGRRLAIESTAATQALIIRAQRAQIEQLKKNERDKTTALGDFDLDESNGSSSSRAARTRSDSKKRATPHSTSTKKPSGRRPQKSKSGTG